MNQDDSPRILIVDDEPGIRQLLTTNLTANGFYVQAVPSGQEAIQQTTTFHPHLILLDLGLPDVDGMTILLQLRKWTQIPILILTVDDNEKSKVELLDAGADDYLTKPFGIPELLARVRAALRRNHQIEATPIFVSGDLEIDLNRREALVHSKAIKLTATEFELLRALVRSNGRVVPQAQLLRDVWGPNAVEQVHYLRIYIGQLRKKLEANPLAPQHILTEPGVGYRLV